MMAARVQRGIASVIISVCRTEPKNNSTAAAASNAPEIAELVTSAKELRINTDSSKVGVSTISAGINPDCRSSSILCLTPSTTAIVFASGCF